MLVFFYDKIYAKSSLDKGNDGRKFYTPPIDIFRLFVSFLL